MDIEKQIKKIKEQLIFDKHAFNLQTSEIKNNKEIVLQLLNVNNFILQYASENIRDDRDVLLKAVERRGLDLEHGSERLRSDKEIILTAINNSLCGQAMQFISEDSKKEVNLMKEIVVLHPLIFMHMLPEIKNNKIVALEALKGYGLNIANISDENLLKDIEVIRIAVKKSGHALRFASKDLQDNKSIVLIAVQKTGIALAYASDRLKDDKNIVMKAIENEGVSIMHASSRLKDDLQLATLAIEKDGHNIHHVSDRLKNDKAFALKALEKNPAAFKNIGEKLKEEIGENEPISYLKYVMLKEVINNNIAAKETIVMKNKL